VSILMGNGDGTFGVPKVYNVGTGDRGGLAVGDYFGNGRQDIAVAIFGSSVAILPNNGDGTFGACHANRCSKRNGDTAVSRRRAT
jgi:hypothetical protein